MLDLETKNQSLEFLEVRCPVSRRGIPSLSGIPSSAQDDARSSRLTAAGLCVHPVASHGVPASNIGQDLRTILVDQGVQPSQGRLARPEARVIQQAHEARPDRGCRARASTGRRLAGVDDLVVWADAVSSHVWEASAREIGVLAIVGKSGVGDGLEVLRDGGVLVRGAREVAAEAARASVPGNFRRDIDRAADGCEIRACGGENGVELDGLVVRGQASCSHSEITGGLDNRDASQTQHANQVARKVRIIEGYRLDKEIRERCKTGKYRTNEFGLIGAWDSHLPHLRRSLK